MRTIRPARSRVALTATGSRLVRTVSCYRLTTAYLIVAGFMVALIGALGR